MFFKKERARKINYYFWASYRRKSLDRLLFSNQHLYRGVVLDIGGRDKGIFKSPKDKVEKWITTDIVSDRNPDMVMDVADMHKLEDESIDVINALELFEHVAQINKGLDECVRVLKKEGIFIISVPFLYPLHADPFDFQRWTKIKWEKELKKRGLEIEKFQITGRYFSVMGNGIKASAEKVSYYLRLLIYLTYPLLDLIVALDKTNWLRKHKVLGNYHEGYFIVAKKK